jgi:hypothetical protein
MIDKTYSLSETAEALRYLEPSMPVENRDHDGRWVETKQEGKRRFFAIASSGKYAGIGWWPSLEEVQASLEPLVVGKARKQG